MERSVVYRSGKKHMSRDGSHPNVDAFDRPTDRSLIDLDRCQTVDHQEQSTFDRFLNLHPSDLSSAAPSLKGIGSSAASTFSQTIERQSVAPLFRSLHFLRKYLIFSFFFVNLPTSSRSNLAVPLHVFGPEIDFHFPITCNGQLQPADDCVHNLLCTAKLYFPVVCIFLFFLRSFGSSCSRNAPSRKKVFLHCRFLYFRAHSICHFAKTALGNGLRRI